jgi:hypothetical protein
MASNGGDKNLASQVSAFYSIIVRGGGRAMVNAPLKKCTKTTFSNSKWVFPVECDFHCSQVE